LTGIGRLRDRESVLRSILKPNAEIAPGFESVLVEKVDGTTIAGILKLESPTALEIQTPEDGLIQVPKSGIRTRERGPSAMPDGLGELMTLRELRDLVEALSE
jgi:quinoprotein glucose dehydrogenase